MLIIITGCARSSAHQYAYKQNHTRYRGKGIGVCACWSDKCLVDPSFKRCLIAPRRGHKDKGGEPRMNGYGHPPDRTRHLFFFTSDYTTPTSLLLRTVYSMAKTHTSLCIRVQILPCCCIRKESSGSTPKSGPRTCEDGKVRLLSAYK